MSATADPVTSDRRHVLAWLTPYVSEADEAKRFRQLWSRLPVEAVAAALRRLGRRPDEVQAIMEGLEPALAAPLKAADFPYPIHDPAPLIVFAEGLTLAEVSQALAALRAQDVAA